MAIIKGEIIKEELIRGYTSSIGLLFDSIPMTADQRASLETELSLLETLAMKNPKDYE